ncbi:MAG: HlyD family efflux transporter periplasmic adaptor subunit, partial [Clostridia bacterium]|nr:HlyD family efflux transporter periplasmic adaptor subunit [Clostridia bacterium]
AAKIETYKNAPETTDVTAPIAGRIVSVNFVPGDTVTSGNTVAAIEIADKGYICEITMDTEEARKIQIGAPCSISNSWWYSNVEASVTQIRSVPQSQGQKRIVTIEVKGDVYEGQSLSFTIGDKSQSYDTVLPNSAIREDNDGKFVLVVDSKNTPLSVRYTARRVNIEVIASDDTQSAVSGLYGSEFVITNSTTPISDKQQVRLAEN